MLVDLKAKKDELMTYKNFNAVQIFNMIDHQNKGVITSYDLAKFFEEHFERKQDQVFEAKSLEQKRMELIRIKLKQQVGDIQNSWAKEADNRIFKELCEKFRHFNWYFSY